MRTKLKVVARRRKREGKTNYPKRLRLLKGARPRLVVRPSLRNITAQVITHTPIGDRVLAGVQALSLDKFGWAVHKGNIPAAYLTGYLLGKIVMKKGIKECILDTGLYYPVRGGRIFACVKGMKDAGMNVPADESAFPSTKRIRGEHIAAYAKDNGEHLHDYKRKGIDPTTITDIFERVKKAIEEKT